MTEKNMAAVLLMAGTCMLLCGCQVKFIEKIPEEELAAIRGEQNTGTEQETGGTENAETGVSGGWSQVDPEEDDWVLEPPESAGEDTEDAEETQKEPETSEIPDDGVELDLEISQESGQTQERKPYSLIPEGYTESSDRVWTTAAADLFRHPQRKGISPAGIAGGIELLRTGISEDGKTARVETADGQVWYMNAAKLTTNDPDKKESAQPSEKPESTAQESSETPAEKPEAESTENNEPAQTETASPSSQSPVQNTEPAVSEQKPAQTTSAAEKEESSDSSPAQSQPAQTSPGYEDLPGVKISYTPKEPDSRTGRTYDFVVDGQQFVNVSLSAKCVYTYTVGNAPREVTGYGDTADRVGTISAGQAVTVTAVGNNGWCKLDWNGVSAYVPTDTLRRN